MSRTEPKAAGGRGGDVDDCRLIDLACHVDERGGLAVAEAAADLGFAVERVYWLYATEPGARRAGHAHRRLRQCYVAVSGSLRVALDDGRRRRDVVLDRPDQGLLIGPGMWRDVCDFSPGAVLLVMASAPYDESDYIRDHAAFIAEYGHVAR